jgi:hypothetical protein
MTTIPNWLLTALFLLAVWGAMIALFVLGTAVWEWLDTWKKKREQAQKYQHLAVWDDAVECVDLLESKNNV